MSTHAVDTSSNVTTQRSPANKNPILKSNMNNQMQQSEYRNAGSKVCLAWSRICKEEDKVVMPTDFHREKRRQGDMSHIIQVRLQPLPPSIQTDSRNAAGSTATNTMNGSVPDHGDSAWEKGNNNVADRVAKAALLFERKMRQRQHTHKAETSQPPSHLDIVYVDEYLVVVNKPPGVLTVPGLHGRSNSLLDQVYRQFGGKGYEDQKGLETGSYSERKTLNPVHMIVHRLDMDTSGIVVFGRSLAITKQLQALFRHSTVEASLDHHHSRSKYRRCPHIKPTPGTSDMDQGRTASSKRVHKEYECLVMGHLIPIPMRHGDGDNNSNNNNSVDDIDVHSTTIPTTIYIDLPLQRDHTCPPFMRVSTPQSEQDAADVLLQLQTHDNQTSWKHLQHKAPKSSQTIVRIMEYLYWPVLSTTNISNDNDPNHNQYPKGLVSSFAGANACNTPSSSSAAFASLTQMQQMLPCTRLRLLPRTGRTHQLRVHCAALGYPIVGDPTYSLQGEASPEGGLVVPDPVQRLWLDLDPQTLMKDDSNPKQRLVRRPMHKCSHEIQQIWNQFYPPNVRPMCLHAAQLHLDTHPITVQSQTWMVPVPF